MNPAQKAINEMLPMITDFLILLGMTNNGKVDFISSLNPFSEWVSNQEVSQENYGYLVSRLAAYFCHYYVQKCGAEIKEINNTIQLQLPMGSDAWQSIDPYFFASMVAQKRLTLVQAIDANVS